MAESIPSARQSTLRMPSASRSSLSHWTTVRPGMLAFSIGTISHSGRLVRTMPPTCCDRWRGKPRISRTRWINCRPRRLAGSRPASRQAEEQLVALVGMTDRLGQGVDPVERQAQSLADVAHRGTRPIGDQFGRHPGPFAAVLLVDVLNHFFAALMLEVDVDVRGFVAILGDEPLEQDIDPIRVDRRDPQAIADRRVGRRAASLAEDALGRGRSGPGPRRSGNRPRNSAPR